MPSGPYCLLLTHNLISFGLPTTNISTLSHFAYNYFSPIRVSFFSSHIDHSHHPLTSLEMLGTIRLRLPKFAIVISHTSQPSSRPDFHAKGTGRGGVRGLLRGARCGNPMSLSEYLTNFLKFPVASSVLLAEQYYLCLVEAIYNK